MANLRASFHRPDKNPETVIVFGAGASIPPLLSQKDLVSRLLDATEERTRAAKRYLNHTFLGLKADRFIPESIRFEDIVGPLEIAESEEYWYHFAGREADKTRKVITNKEVLDSLDSWVAIALDPQFLPRPTRVQPPSQRTPSGC
jgi:hypothetical protein